MPTKMRRVGRLYRARMAKRRGRIGRAWDAVRASVAPRIAVLLVIALLGAVATRLAWTPVAVPAPPPPPAENVPVPKLTIGGRELPEGKELGDALDLVRKYALSTVKLKVPDGRAFELVPADFGLEVDRLRLDRFIKEARKQGSSVARAHALRAGPDQPLEVPLPVTVDGERALAQLAELKIKVDAPSQDATIDLDKRIVKPETIGYRLDVYATLARVEAGFRNGRAEIDAAGENIVPKRVAAQLKDVEFKSVLGWFETRYNTAGKFAARAQNLALAARRLDGTVLMPGETFDFNEVVGPRDEAHGYQVAPVIAQGELVDGIGGGTCQISGTLHAAVFFAGLEIEQRYPHSRPSSYIPLGLDATVAYPNITYRFKNSFDFPIVLHERVAGGVVRAEILGPERKLTVSFFRRIDELLPFDEIERPSEKLPSGKRVVVQRGIPGFIATSSRLVRDGAYGERTKWKEKYPPTTQIVAVGTGEADTKEGVFQDKHPEYLVDEYRVMTQGPSIKSKDEPGAGMADARVPGKMGEAGWIKKLGFEKTPIDEDATEKPKADEADPSAKAAEKDKGKDKDKDKDKEKDPKKPKKDPKKDKTKKKEKEKEKGGEKKDVQKDKKKKKPEAKS